MQDEQGDGVKALHQSMRAAALALAAYCAQEYSPIISFPFEVAIVVNPDELWEGVAWKGKLPRIAAAYPKIAGEVEASAIWKSSCWIDKKI